jgi:dipeptidyl aminopeptidase/acylaminoacyl peptidase
MNTVRTVFSILYLLLSARMHAAELDWDWQGVAPEARAAYLKVLENSPFNNTEGEVTPNWSPDGRTFWFQEKTGSTNSIVVIDTLTGRRSIQHEPPTTAQANVSEPRRLAARYPFTWDDFEPLYERPDPTGRFFLGHESGNLYVRDARRDETKPLTRDATNRIAWNAFATRWSSDGNHVAAVQVDASQVNQIPVVQFLQRSQPVQFYDLPLAGGHIGTSRLVILDRSTGTAEHEVLNNVDNDFLSLDQFSDDGQEFRFFRISREARRVEYLAYRLATRKLRSIFVEESKTFVMTHAVAGYPISPWSEDLELVDVGDGVHFIWASARSGWRHYYLYSYDGTLVRRITQGEFGVVDVAHIDRARGYLYFRARTDSARPHDVHVHRVHLDGGATLRLTAGVGVHSAHFAPLGNAFVDNYSSARNPPVAVLRDSTGRRISILADTSMAQLEALGWQPPEERVVKAADGETDLHAILYKPAHFSPNKRYPVVEHIYGGHFTTNVPHRFQDHVLSAFALTRLGFAVVVSDARGTPERSKAFQDVGYRKFGQHEIQDHAAVLRQLGAHYPWLDLTRVGIYGSSYGGYFAARALLLAPDLYKVGIALAPAEIDPDDEVIHTETMLGLPAENPEGYRLAANATHAAKLRGKLLLIFGTSDVSVPMRAPLRFAQALINAGKPFDMFVVPQANHHFATEADGPAEPYVSGLRTKYLVEHLMPGVN